MSHSVLKRSLPLVLVMLFTLGSLAHADTITIDFDTVGVTSGIGDPTSYLSGFGVTVSQTYTTSATNPAAAQIAVIDDRYIYTGWDGTGSDPTLYLQAPSSHNVFTQYANNGPLTFTLHFASPLSSFSFASVGIGPASQATSFPAWAAVAYDSSGSELDSTSQSSAVNRTTSTLSLSTTGYLIDYVTFYRDGSRGTAYQNWSAYSHVILDDLVLTQAAVPEPSTLATLGVMLGMGWMARRSRRRKSSSN